MAAADTFLVRLRGKAGTWRIPGVDRSTTVGQLKQRVFEMKAVSIQEQAISTSMGGGALPDSTTLGELGASNGFMLFVSFEAEVAPATSVKKVAADGSITYMSSEELAKARGYKPGVPSMRDMQKQWNWMDFMDLQRSLEWKVVPQEKPHCTKATIDTNAAQDLTAYLQGLAYQTSRIAYLYGRFTSDGGIKASAIWEPPQTNTPQGWTEHDAGEEGEAVGVVANLLGLVCVGMIIAHPPRDEDILLSGEEIVAAAMKQGGAGKDSPFAIFRLSANEKGEAIVQAYQVSDQFMEMLAAGAVAPHPSKPGELDCSAKFHVIMEAKAQESLPTTVFLVNVAVAQYASGLSAGFPKASRLGRPVQREEVRTYFTNAKAKGMGLVAALADFNLLVHLASVEMVAPVVPALSQAVLSGAETLEEGHKLMLMAYADMEW